MNVVVENRTRSRLDFVVYHPVEEGHTHLREKWLIRLEDSKMRDHQLQQPDGSTKPPEPGKPFERSRDMAADPVFSPICIMTEEQWEELLGSHNGPTLQTMLKAGDLTVQKVMAPDPEPVGEEAPAAPRARRRATRNRGKAAG